MEPIPMLASDPAIARALDLLAPSAGPDVDGALGRQLALQARSAAPPSGWTGRLALLSRPAVALPLAAGLVAALLVATPARGWAASVLTIFRVQDVTPITVDRVSQPLPNLSKLGDMSPPPGDVRRMQPTQVTSLAAASSQVGFTVQTPSQLPAGLGPQPSVIATTNPSTVNFTFRAAKAKAYLESTGHPNVTMPAKFDGATLTLHIPAVASLAYLPAGANLSDLTATASSAKAGGKPDASAINRLLDGSGVLVMEAKSPELDATGVSAGELRDFLLSLDIPDSLKTQLRSIGDWRNTLPVPAEPGSNLHKVSVNGASGVAGRNGGTQMVLWVKNGMVFAAAGPKLDEAALLSLASSVN
ncbi:MAG TPA: hypothetical protein VMW62_02135 [Chloroflexota bacterium]|nr:hypothetical protein [Chloroflexota bacterium]